MEGEKFELMKAVFKELAQEESAEYNFNDKKYDGFMGARIATTNHIFKVWYRDILIEVKYDLGNHNLGYFKSAFNANSQLYDFKITSNNLGFRKYVETKLLECDLEEYAQNRRWDPEIALKKNGSKVEINTRFYLGFEDKDLIIQPMIRFYESIVDYAMNMKSKI